ncbi:ATP-binding protein [Actinacidiphila sp. bgisy160]|uniref:ATP-binding protein n=1 Tax=Actinacidiphila sp. bgisy160 TaxID=3413796 RepID=UPI003D720D40
MPITDSGPGFTAAVNPEQLPGHDSHCGRGLWLTRTVTDHLTIATATVGAVVTLALRPH